MTNAKLLARLTLVYLLALSGLFLTASCYVRADAPPAPTLPLQSLRELSEPTGVTSAPRIQSWTLKQGSRVLFVENHSVPMVDLKISFAAGSYYDGKTPGLAAMAQALFSVDSALKQADEIAREFDRYGVKITHGLNAEQSYFNLRSLSEPAVFNPVMALFTETLTRPKFSQANLSRIKRALQTDLELEQIIPQMRALAHIRAHLYPGQPSSHSIYGTSDSLERIEAKQLRDFNQRAYTAGNLKMVIVGDLTPEQARSLSQTFADALPQGPALPAPQMMVGAVNAGQALHLEDPSSQTLLMLAQNALPDQHPDAIAIRIANVIFNHVLNGQLREKHSVTYGVKSDIEPAQGTATWVIQLNTPPQYSQEAMRHAQALFADFLKSGPSEEQLNTLKKYLRHALPQLLATNKNLLDELEVINRFDQTLNFSHKTDEIQKMTTAQIKAAMNRHLAHSQWTTLTLGPSVAQLPLPDINSGEDSSQPLCNSTNWTSTGPHSLLGQRAVLWQLKHFLTPVTD